MCVFAFAHAASVICVCVHVRFSMRLCVYMCVCARVYACVYALQGCLSQYANAVTIVWLLFLVFPPAC